MSWFITVCCTFDLVSTVGESPVTVIVSLTLAHFELGVDRRDERGVDEDVVARDPRKPCSSNLTMYAPGGSRSNRYAPVVSVTCVCGAANQPVAAESVTVTPGSTAPLVSVTMPVIEPVWTCACAVAAASTQSMQSTTRKTNLMRPRFR